MFEIKMKARYLIHGRRSSLGADLLRARVMLTGFICCIFVLTVTGSIKEERLWENIPLSRTVIFIISLVSCLMFLFLYFASRLYFNARLFYITDKSFTSPDSLLNFLSVIRYTVFVTVLRGLKLMWLIFFCSPSVFLFAAVARVFIVNGGIPVVMLIALLCSGVLTFIAGTVFYTATTGRYLLCEMLFMRNPRQNPFEIIRTATGFAKGKLTVSVFYRLTAFFRKGVYGKIITVLLVSDIFSERKYYESLGARKSRLYQSMPKAL